MPGDGLNVVLRPGESQNSMIERFTRGFRRSGLAREMREREHFVSRSEARRKSKARSIARNRRTLSESE